MAKLTKITACEETREETAPSERWLNLADVDEVKQRTAKDDNATPPEPGVVELWCHTEHYNFSRLYCVQGTAAEWAKIVNDLR